MNEASHIASFTYEATYEKLSDEVIARSKAHLLDALGYGLGALDAFPMVRLRSYVQEMGGNPSATTIGGIKTSPSWAAFYNSALFSFFDCDDSQLAQAETCRPSDNVGAVLAATEHVDGQGKDFLTALAVAHQVHHRLSEIASVRADAFAHTAPGACAVAAGAAKALGLPEVKIAQAIATCATSNNALRVTRTEGISLEKVLACANTAFNGVHAAFLARAGLAGPIDEFDGNQYFSEIIFGSSSINWHGEKLDAASRPVFNIRTMSWDAVAERFCQLASRHASPALRNAIVEAVFCMDRLPIRRLTHLLSMTRSQIELGSPWSREAS